MENDKYLISKELQQKLNLLATMIFADNNERNITDILNDQLEFNTLFNQLYSESNKNDYYWQYCTLNTYEQHYAQREKEFINQYPDANDKDFAQNELKEIQENYISIKEKVYIDPDHGYPVPEDVEINSYCYKFKFIGLDPENLILNFLTPDIIQKIEYTQKAKIEFLKAKCCSIIQFSEQDSKTNSEEIIDNKDIGPNADGIDKVAIDIEKPEDYKDLKHIRIFTKNNFKLFEHINNEFVRSNYKVKDYSYIYWQMREDGEIHYGVRPVEFLTWLQHNNYLQEEVLQLYSEHRKTPNQRKKEYNNIKSSY
ncbi:hypothetical protein [Draconibacterium sediminis]|uniref:Uncharacterized protein n=1 Tax=Draconibacterium sediminis TaxID=1544798 RepID=A0A0D8JCN6_9BACT|nr:hypothetical protein [Draconibacterium sediminis]KJF44286.1 hypothetical protein LH29_01870 [Draconibacterium sediminis]